VTSDKQILLVLVLHSTFSMCCRLAAATFAELQASRPPALLQRVICAPHHTSPCLPNMRLDQLTGRPLVWPQDGLCPLVHAAVTATAV
jgi:hypothetical protein